MRRLGVTTLWCLGVITLFLFEGVEVVEVKLLGLFNVLVGVLWNTFLDWCLTGVKRLHDLFLDIVLVALLDTEVSS